MSGDIAQRANALLNDIRLNRENRSISVYASDRVHVLADFIEQLAASNERRIKDLLEANNRYLEQARRNRHWIETWKKSTLRSIQDAASLRNEIFDLKRKLADANMKLNELQDPKRGSFTYLEMEAALCVWEWIVDQTNPANGSRSEAEVNAEIWRDAVGTVEARHASYEIGRYCLEVYERGKEIAGPDAWDAVPYDWQVIPAICETIEFSADGWHPSDLTHAARQALKSVTEWRDEEKPVQRAGVQPTPGVHENFATDIKQPVRTFEDIRPDAFCSARPAPARRPDAADRIERLKAAIEGELDGLAIDDIHAAAILHYLETGK